jgi:RimJ/RimL family protein N-acetyltransferase
MKFKLRPWNSEDLDSLVQYANNFNIAKNLTNQFPYPYTREAGEAFIKMAAHDHPRRIFVIEVNGEAAGGIGLHLQTDIHAKNAELGYWLAEPYWGKGIMTQAVKQMVEYGFKTFDVDRIFARPFGTNLGSQKVLEKAGFVLEARLEKTLFKNGEYLDELIYSVRRKDDG